MPHLLEPDTPLGPWLVDHSEPVWRSKAIRRWLFASRAESFDDMTDLPKGLREALSRDFTIWTTTIARHHRAEDGTEKLLLELHDGQRIECVLLRDGDRRTVCISSQVGCAMGCVFCASWPITTALRLSMGLPVREVRRSARNNPGASSNREPSTAILAALGILRTADAERKCASVATFQ